ncbi:hypothetical protein I4F81_008918 [Pyropia yezoensis]|uniref:Uncharacterized protein n=1 Tax=Pyropia yezoensis TaxID=2788 RepID=A0ACC3C940_PYRYE|nr:hypothetical protein I4F81_008918 [Neopyropia yezoensis]
MVCRCELRRGLRGWPVAVACGGGWRGSSAGLAGGVRWPPDLGGGGAPVVPGQVPFPLSHAAATAASAPAVATAASHPTVAAVTQPRGLWPEAVVCGAGRLGWPAGLACGGSRRLWSAEVTPAVACGGGQLVWPADVAGWCGRRRWLAVVAGDGGRRRWLLTVAFGGGLWR